MMSMMDVALGICPTDTAAASYCVRCGTHYPTYQGHICNMTIDLTQLKATEEATNVCAKTLQTALELTSGDRAKQHGDKRQNHQNIADLWNAQLGVLPKTDEHVRSGVGTLTRPLTAHDVAVMMCLLKIARLKSGSHNPDNYVDLAGYAGVAAECADV